MAATVPWVKFADPGESDAFAANCFPVRGLLQSADDGGGAWLVSQKAEQRRRFKAVLCAKPRTYSRIKEERKKAEREGTQITMPVQSLAEGEIEEEEEAPALDGFFLMKHCCVEDPSDLCSVNIAGQEMSEVKEDDLALFDSVAYVNAAENYLPFEAFRGFPILRELEMPINGLRGVKIQNGDYPYLEMLDLSYNNLSQDDLLTLGTLPNLKILHLTGNNFHTIPMDFALPYVDRETKSRIVRYSKLEILMLDDNRLSDVAVFAALAGLKRLKHLNLEKNDIYYVPQLKSVEGTMIINDDEKSTRRLQKSARLSARRSARGQKSQKPQNPPPEKMEKQDPPSEKVKSQQAIEPEPKQEESPKEPNPSESTELFASFTDVGAEFGDLSDAIKDIDLQESEPVDEESSRPSPVKSKSNNMKDKAAPKEPPAHLASGLPPFPELAYLNLAHNRIAEEEALLAVAAWPMLVELVIHNNPLTSDHSGDPPLLKRFLTARLGIKLVRKVEQPKSKPQVVVPPKRKRKISSIVPKIPKLTFEERLMLEPPPPKEDKSRTIDGLDLHQAPLPPIPSQADEPEGIPPSPQYNKLFDTESTKSESPEITINVPTTPDLRKMGSQVEEPSTSVPPSAVYSRMQSPPEESSTVPPSAVYSRMQSPPEESSTVPPSAVYSRMQSPPKGTTSGIPESAVYSRMMSNEEQPAESADKKDEKEAAFFMTQVDEPEEEKKAAPVRPKRKEKSEKRPKRKDVPDKYKGYEILLDVDEDPDFHAPKDMQGNIKALKYALNHELVYRDSAALLHKVGKPVPPYQKWQMPPQPPRKSKQQKIDEVLESLKNRSTTEEANLSSVLKDSRKLKKFNQAPVLLSEIQSRYNAVRVSSMKEAKEAKKAMQDLQNLANNRPLSIK